MKKIIILSFLIFSFENLYAQKLGYVDTDFILNKMPEYKKAQGEVDRLSSNWQTDLAKMGQEIEKEFQDFKAEEVLLTPEMKKSKLDTLDKHRVRLAETQKKYFGFEGLLFLKRQEIVKPILDKMYEAIEKVCRVKRIDFLLNKGSNDVALLYTNPVHDYTEYVLEELNLATDNADYSAPPSASSTPDGATTEEQVPGAATQEKASKPVDKKPEIKKKSK